MVIVQEEGAAGLQAGTFDTIVCLSVTKWVHLNGGDEALQALLAKVWRLLAPGGRFLLEPQPWRSYLAAVHKQGRAAQKPVGDASICSHCAMHPPALLCAAGGAPLCAWQHSLLHMCEQDLHQHE